MSISTKNKVLSVIIVTYNSEKYIGKCIESLFRYWPKSLKKQIIVIDNASKDSTVENLKKISNIEFYKNTKNLGFAKAVNQAIDKAKGDYVLLLNPDTEIMSNSLRNLVQCLDKNKCGIVGGASFKNNGEQHGTYVREPHLMIGLFDFSNLQKLFPENKWHRSFYYSELKNVSKDIEVDAVGGGFMLIDKSVLREVGYFDERFFMYLEDIDFCVRARKQGYKVYYCPNSKISHIGGASSDNKEHINFEAWVDSRKYYYKKHGSIFDNIILQPAYLIDELLMRIKRLI